MVHPLLKFPSQCTGSHFKPLPLFSFCLIGNTLCNCHMKTSSCFNIFEPGLWNVRWQLGEITLAGSALGQTAAFKTQLSFSVFILNTIFLTFFQHNLIYPSFLLLYNCYNPLGSCTSCYEVSCWGRFSCFDVTWLSTIRYWGKLKLSKDNPGNEKLQRQDSAVSMIRFITLLRDHRRCFAHQNKLKRCRKL